MKDFLQALLKQHLASIDTIAEDISRLRAETETIQNCKDEEITDFNNNLDAAKDNLIAAYFEIEKAIKWLDA